MHLLLEMMGSLTSLRTGEICPYSDSRPQPVTVPICGPIRGQCEVR